MKSAFFLALSIVASGCAHRGKIAIDDNAMVLGPDEAIEQIQLEVQGAEYVGTKGLPADWSASGINSAVSASVTLGPEHQHFADRDIRGLLSCIRFRPVTTPKIMKMDIYITQGPVGVGRIVHLAEPEVTFQK